MEVIGGHRSGFSLEDGLVDVRQGLRDPLDALLHLHHHFVSGVHYVLGFVDELLDLVICVPLQIVQTSLQVVVHLLDPLFDQRLLHRMQARDDVVVIIHDQIQLANLFSVLIVLREDVLRLFRHFLVQQFEIFHLPQEPHQ